MKEYQATDTMRNKAIYKMHKKKISFAKIGRKYGLSRERIRQICQALDKLPKRSIIVSEDKD